MYVFANQATVHGGGVSRGTAINRPRPRLVLIPVLVSAHAKRFSSLRKQDITSLYVFDTFHLLFCLFTIFLKSFYPTPYF